MTVDLAALFAELADSSGSSPAGALTMAEIMAHTQKSRPLAQRLVLKAQEVGLCEATRTRRRGIDGIDRMVQAYIFKTQEVAE